MASVGHIGGPTLRPKIKPGSTGVMVRALPVIGGVLLCAVNCARAFMPTPVQSISIVTKPCEQGMLFTRLPRASSSRSLQVWAGEEEGAPSGWDSAMVKLGFKKEAGEGTRSMKEQLKSAGLAGVLSYVSSEVLFWAISLPLGVLAWHAQTGEWLDLSTGEGQAKVAGFSAAFLAFARVALPVRAAVALALTPAVDKYIVRPLIERGVINEQPPQQ